MTQIAAVTGAEGFIGSHLVESLVSAGWRVRAMVLYNSLGSHGWLENLHPKLLAEVEVVLGDVRDMASVTSLLRGVDVVYHLAALIAIPYSYEAPRSYVDTNVGGTLNVLEASRALEVGRIVHTSTSEVYGTAREVPISESHPLQAQSPYSATKISADKLVESYHLSFGLPAVTLRPFNTYGPRQSARAVIPTIISQLANGATTLRLGNVEPTRDFTYVTDTAAAFVAVGSAPEERVVGRVLNGGTGTEISVGDLARKIAELMEVNADVEQEAQRLRPGASEVMRLLADNSALRQATGWRPEQTLSDGLAQTIDWFRKPENLGLYRVGVYSR